MKEMKGRRFAFKRSAIIVLLDIHSALDFLRSSALRHYLLTYGISEHWVGPQKVILSSWETEFTMERNPMVSAFLPQYAGHPTHFWSLGVSSIQVTRFGQPGCPRSTHGFLWIVAGMEYLPSMVNSMHCFFIYCFGLSP